MKSFLFTCRIFFVAAFISSFDFTVRGQGTFIFNTFIHGSVDAPVRLSDGTGPGLSSGWVAQMFHVRSDNSVVPLSPSTTFRSTSAASFYVMPSPEGVRVPGVPVGSMATLRLRAWNSENGETYETATLRGESSDLTIRLGGTPVFGPPIPDPPLIGLQGFTIVPEPSIISLALLGAVLLLRKRHQFSQKAPPGIEAWPAK